MSLKAKLIEKTTLVIQTRIQSINAELKKIQEDANSETKSSMGDKYETGRAMAQNEKIKLNQNKIQFLRHLETLNKVSYTTNNTIDFGSVVHTNQMNIFLCTSIGELTVKDQKYFTLSPITPIAKQLIGLNEGSKFTFNNQEWEIQMVEN